MTSEELLSTLGNFVGLLGIALFAVSLAMIVVSPELQSELIGPLAVSSSLMGTNMLTILYKRYGQR